VAEKDQMAIVENI